MENAVAKFTMTEAEITKRLGMTFEDLAELDKRYRAIIVTGTDDNANYKAAHAARMELVHFRSNITKGGKALRDEANAFSKLVISIEKKIVDRVTPIEDHLLAQEKIVDDEKARIKAEADAKEAARIKARLDKLYAIGCVFRGQFFELPFTNEYTVMHGEVTLSSDAQFLVIAEKFQILVNNEHIRLEKEKIEKKQEEERLAAIREEQAKKQKALDEQFAVQQERERKIKADQEKIEREKQRLIDEEVARKKKIQDEKDKAEAEKKRKEELEKAKKEAAAKAIKDAEAKAERERIAAEKKAARQPDKVKLIAFADAIDKISCADLKTEEAITIRVVALKGLIEVTNKIRKHAEEL
jgi:hypothetical protein